MKKFLFRSPVKIKFGEGAALHIADLFSELGVTRPFVVSDKNISATESFQKVIRALESSGFRVGLYTDAVSDPPVDVCDKAAALLKNGDYDVCVAIGGGSSIDTAKSMCMLVHNEGSVRDYLFGGTKTVKNPSLPLICVPTTAGSGSEVTAACVITETERNVKLSVTHENLLPRYAVIDPAMQSGMPPFVTATTGMDALTHAIEAYTSLDANMISDAYAEKAIKLITQNIRTAVWNPSDMNARSSMAVASTMAAVAFVNAGLGAVHGISQSMGGVAHVAHGTANSLILPYVMEKNIPGCVSKFAEIARLMGESKKNISEREQASCSVQAVRQLSEDIRIPKTLREVGVTEDMFDTIVKETMAYRLLPLNPVKFCKEDVYDILKKAW